MSDARLSGCLIVRDNQPTRPCLESIQAWVDEVIVVDTGSSDGTPEIAQEYGVRLLHFPWVDDFSAARNESLQHASSKWLFWMGSDDTLPEMCGRRLRQVAYGEHDPDTLGYVMQVRCPGPSGEAEDVTVVDHVKMFWNHPEIRFEGRIHEQVLPSIRRLGGKVEWTDIYVVHSGSDQSPAGRRGKYGRDLRILALDLQDRPDHPFVLFNLGMTFADMGDFRQAEQYLRRCLEVSDASESHVRKAFALLINALSRLDKHDEAWELCQEGRHRFPRDVELRFREALLHHHFGRLAEAEQSYRAVIEERDDRHFTSIDAGIGSYKARHNLAVVYRDMGRLEHAEAQWRAVLDEVPTFRPALRALGEILLSQGRALTAELEVQRRLNQEQRSLRVEGVLLQARFAEKAGDNDAAHTLLERAIDEAPNDSDVLEAWSRHCFEQGRPQDAVSVLSQLVDLQPDDAAAWHNLGTAQLAAGEHSEATQSLRRSIDLRPYAAGTHLQLSYALRAAGDGAGAIDAYHKAARLEPSIPPVEQTSNEPIEA
jgi:tetratricopeptide (TPR) repeat protein